VLGGAGVLKQRSKPPAGWVNMSDPISFILL
jgi:hypothetical protein